MRLSRVIATLAVVAGCSGRGTSGASTDGGSTEGGSTGGGSGLALSQLSAKYAAALCAQNFKCVPAAAIGTRTMMECVDTNKCALDFEASSIGDGIARGRVSYDPNQAAACVDAIAQISCDDWDKGFAETTQPAVCASAVVGKVAAGGACLDDVECATHFCHGEDPSMNLDGKCVDSNSLGQACAGSADCASGFYCDLDSQVCAAQEPAGQPCMLEAECLTSCDDSTQQCSPYAGCALGGAEPRRPLLVGVMLAVAILLARRRPPRSA
jgi:hypothetical protein